MVVLPRMLNSQGEYTINPRDTRVINIGNVFPSGYHSFLPKLVNWKDPATILPVIGNREVRQKLRDTREGDRLFLMNRGQYNPYLTDEKGRGIAYAQGIPVEHQGFGRFDPIIFEERLPQEFPSEIAYFNWKKAKEIATNQLLRDLGFTQLPKGKTREDVINALIKQPSLINNDASFGSQRQAYNTIGKDDEFIRILPLLTTQEGDASRTLHSLYSLQPDRRSVIKTGKNSSQLQPVLSDEEIAYINQERIRQEVESKRKQEDYAYRTGREGLGYQVGIDEYGDEFIYPQAEITLNVSPTQSKSQWMEQAEKITGKYHPFYEQLDRQNNLKVLTPELANETQMVFNKKKWDMNVQSYYSPDNLTLGDIVDGNIQDINSELTPSVVRQYQRLLELEAIKLSKQSGISLDEAYLRAKSYPLVNKKYRKQTSYLAPISREKPLSAKKALQIKQILNNQDFDDNVDTIMSQQYPEQFSLLRKVESETYNPYFRTRSIADTKSYEKALELRDEIAQEVHLERMRQLLEKELIPKDWVETKDSYGKTKKQAIKYSPEEIPQVIEQLRQYGKSTGIDAKNLRNLGETLYTLDAQQQPSITSLGDVLAGQKKRQEIVDYFGDTDTYNAQSDVVRGDEPASYSFNDDSLEDMVSDSDEVIGGSVTEKDIDVYPDTDEVDRLPSLQNNDITPSDILNRLDRGGSITDDDLINMLGLELQEGLKNQSVQTLNQSVDDPNLLQDVYSLSDYNPEYHGKIAQEILRRIDSSQKEKDLLSLTNALSGKSGIDLSGRQFEISRDMYDTLRTLADGIGLQDGIETVVSGAPSTFMSPHARRNKILVVNRKGKVFLINTSGLPTLEKEALLGKKGLLEVNSQIRPSNQNIGSPNQDRLKALEEAYNLYESRNFSKYSEDELVQLLNSATEDEWSALHPRSKDSTAKIKPSVQDYVYKLHRLGDTDRNISFNDIQEGLKHLYLAQPNPNDSSLPTHIYLRGNQLPNLEDEVVKSTILNYANTIAPKKDKSNLIVHVGDRTIELTPEQRDLLVKGDQVLPNLLADTTDSQTTNQPIYEQRYEVAKDSSGKDYQLKSLSIRSRVQGQETNFDLTPFIYDQGYIPFEETPQSLQKAINLSALLEQEYGRTPSDINRLLRETEDGKIGVSTGELSSFNQRTGNNFSKEDIAHDYNLQRQLPSLHVKMGDDYYPVANIEDDVFKQQEPATEILKRLESLRSPDKNQPISKQALESIGLDWFTNKPENLNRAEFEDWEVFGEGSPHAEIGRANWKYEQPKTSAYSVLSELQAKKGKTEPIIRELEDNISAYSEALENSESSLLNLEHEIVNLKLDESIDATEKYKAITKLTSSYDFIKSQAESYKTDLSSFNQQLQSYQQANQELDDQIYTLGKSLEAYNALSENKSGKLLRIVQPVAIKEKEVEPPSTLEVAKLARKIEEETGRSLGNPQPIISESVSTFPSLVKEERADVTKQLTGSYDSGKQRDIDISLYDPIKAQQLQDSIVNHDYKPNALTFFSYTGNTPNKTINTQLPFLLTPEQHNLDIGFTPSSLNPIKEGVGDIPSLLLNRGNPSYVEFDIPFTRQEVQTIFEDPRRVKPILPSLITTQEDVNRILNQAQDSSDSNYESLIQALSTEDRQPPQLENAEKYKQAYQDKGVTHIGNSSKPSTSKIVQELIDNVSNSNIDDVIQQGWMTKHKTPLIASGVLASLLGGLHVSNENKKRRAEKERLMRQGYLPTLEE